MRNKNARKISTVLFTICLILLTSEPLVPAVKQVRVIIERASIYVEPSRTSTRIDVVGRGAILNLLQETKVKDIWYYVSFNSPRYGARISGFIQDSAVEPAVPAPPQTPLKKDEKPLPKVEPERARPPEPAPPPPLKAKEDLPKKPPAAPPIVEALVLTNLPKGKSYKLPRQDGIPRDDVWRVIETAPVKAEKPAAAVREEVKPKPPEIKKKPAETKPETKPAPPQPIITPQVKPPRKGPGFLTFGLGYGSSYGGAGGCLQLNTRMGLSLHAGVGLYPTSLIYSDTDWVTNEMLWSVGLKLYLPFGSSSLAPFIDLQYGGLRVEAAQIVSGIWDYEYVYDTEQKSLWGPSLLVGFELGQGHFAISAGVGASYTTTSWEYLESQNKLSFVFETGLMVHF